MALDNPDLMAPPPMENFQLICSYGHYSVSPIRDEKSGCQIFFFRSSTNNKSYYIMYFNNSRRTFILDRCDEIDLSAEEGFACLVKAIHYVVSKKETRRVLFIVDAKYISLKQLAKGGPFFAKKIASVYKVRTWKLQ